MTSIEVSPSFQPATAESPASPARLVVLVSGSGTLLQSLLQACDDPAYGATVVAVGADRPDIVGLRRAEVHGIPTFVCRVQDYATREQWNDALIELVAGYEPDLVVSAGFLKIVGADFLQRFPGRYLNSHNSLLPAFPGIHAPADALEYGAKVAGATLFVVDEGVDTGAIVGQVVVEVAPDDTVDSLTERIKDVERPQLVECVGRMVREGYSVTGRKVTIG